MSSTFSVLFLLGLLLQVVANLGMRCKTAPAIGSNLRAWPWRASHIYSPTGYWLNLSGWLMWCLAIVVSIVSLIRN